MKACGIFLPILGLTVDKLFNCLHRVTAACEVFCLGKEGIKGALVWDPCIKVSSESFYYLRQTIGFFT